MSDNLDFNQDQLKEVNSIPQFLKVLCVLTLIYISFSSLIDVFSINHGELTKDEMLSIKAEMSVMVANYEKIKFEYGATCIRQLTILKEILNGKYLAFAILSLIINFIGVFGVMKMRSGLKIGFHMYIIYSLLYISQNFFFASTEYIPGIVLYFNLSLSLIFIFMYSRNLKWMK